MLSDVLYSSLELTTLNNAVLSKQNNIDFRTIEMKRNEASKISYSKEQGFLKPEKCSGI